MKIIIHLICSLLLISHVSCEEMREVTVTVTEEDGTPIQGARVQISFIGYTSEQSTRSIELTDENGRHQASGTAPLRMKVMVSKDGYYGSVKSRLSKQKNHDVTMILRKIKNPIPLYAKRYNRFTPEIGVEYGYDMKSGDWVKPHGTGEVSDILVKSEMIRQNDKYKDYEFVSYFRFSNPNDGYLTGKKQSNSKYKSVYEFPRDVEANLKKNWKIFKNKLPGKSVITNYDRNKYYLFRLRTEVDAEGKIISCHYAKGHGDFNDIYLYFNPTPNDRNLEFDPTKNLFKDLDSTEVVREP